MHSTNTSANYSFAFPSNSVTFSSLSSHKPPTTKSNSSSVSSSEDVISVELTENVISLRPVPKPPSSSSSIPQSSSNEHHVNNNTDGIPGSYSALRVNESSNRTSSSSLPRVRRPDSIMLELMDMVMTDEIEEIPLDNLSNSANSTPKKKTRELTPQQQSKHSGGALSGFFRRKLLKEQSAGPLNISNSSILSQSPSAVDYSSPVSNASSTRNLIPSSPMPSPLNLHDSPRNQGSSSPTSNPKRQSPQQVKQLKRKQKWDDKIKRMRQEINSFGFQKQDKGKSNSNSETPELMFERGNGQSLGDVMDENDLQDDVLLQKPSKNFVSNYFSSKFMKDSKNPFLVNRTVNQEHKKTPFLTIGLTIVQIIMFAVSVGLGGLESILVNPLIGPPEATLVQLGAKQGTLIISPNWQVYRLLTPIFLHGGIVHLCLNMMWQMSVMLPLERHWGCIFVCFIYLISGVGGNLLSALFLPEIVTVGASSSLFGILGGVYADLWMNWRYMPSPKRDFILITIQVVAQVIVGLIPWIDNFAHVGGLLVGFLSTMIFIPRMRHPNPYEEQAAQQKDLNNKTPQRRKLLGNSSNEDGEENLDLENGKPSKWKNFSKSKPFKLLYACSAFFCCCFFCCSEKTRRVGKFTLWVRIVSAGLLFSYFAIFGGLYFTQMDWTCRWCYFINPDWDTLYEIFEVVREKIQQ